MLQRQLVTGCHVANMRNNFILIILVIASCFCYACKKGESSSHQNCDTGAATIRTIVSKKATVKLTATATHAIYLVEEGAVDTKLIPCSIGMEYYQNDLSVIISGEVKQTKPDGMSPCCMENIVLTSISK